MNIIMKEEIKGFSKNEIFDLYQFIVIYESEIKNCKVDEVTKKYPDFSKSKWKKILIRVKHEQIIQNAGYKQDPPQNTLWDRNTTTARDCVTRHIRNAIAHSSIEQDTKSSCVSIVDIYPETIKGKHNKGDFSAKYSIDSNIFWQIIRIFTNTTKS